MSSLTLIESHYLSKLMQYANDDAMDEIFSVDDVVMVSSGL